MAEAKTKKVFVRLTRDFPTGVVRRRGGLELSAGPRPVEAQVTNEQLAALKADSMVELVNSKEAQKWADRLDSQEADFTPPTSSDLSGDSQDGDGGRNYGDDDKGGADSSEDTDEDEETETPPTADELKEGNSRDTLIKLADEAGVEGLNYEDKQATTKAVIAEAIVAKRADSSEE